LALSFLFFHQDVSSARNVFQNFIERLKEIFRVIIACGVAWLLAEVLKLFFKTPRPPLALHNVHALFSETGYAFPSGHAIFFSAIAVSLYFINKKVGYWFIFFALLIGLARITAGVHFPMDILGGFIIGSLVAYFMKNV
jgi:undecaprenyl-diphosphatase